MVLKTSQPSFRSRLIDEDNFRCQDRLWRATKEVEVQVEDVEEGTSAFLKSVPH